MVENRSTSTDSPASHPPPGFGPGVPQNSNAFSFRVPGGAARPPDESGGRTSRKQWKSQKAYTVPAAAL